MTCVLVVEDDLVIRSELAEALAAQGYEAESAVSGTEALEVAERHQPDLVLLDLGLPDLDGTAVCRRLRSRVPPAASPPTEASARGQVQGEVRTVGTVSRKGGKAVRVVYRADSSPDPVTGKVVRDEIERYVFHHAGHEAIPTLSGPVGADNVDPWRAVSDSFRWTTP
ncbi:response regulator [Streptosporangium canum]|uniref:response regulator n=1 Tax=Streptosporangium canum TaxID=324952 RepID=UPI0033A6C606